MGISSIVASTLTMWQITTAAASTSTDGIVGPLRFECTLERRDPDIGSWVNSSRFVEAAVRAIDLESLGEVADQRNVGLGALPVRAVHHVEHVGVDKDHLHAVCIGSIDQL